MKVGDLVALSAHGKKLEWLKVLRGRIGVVIANYGVRWTVAWSGKKGTDLAFKHTIDRKSLRHMR